MSRVLGLFRFSMLLALGCVTFPWLAQAQTQSEMNEQAGAEFRAADSQLNKVYQKALASLDDEGRVKLVKAQRAWIAYRDAETEYEADEARGGTIQPMLRAGVMATLTRERIKVLTSAKR